MDSEHEFEAPEGLPEVAEEVDHKTHWQKHRTKYIAGGAAVGGVIIGGSAVAIFLNRVEVVNIIDAFNLKYKSPTETTVITILERRACREPIPVLDTLTGESYASINRAAKVTGESARDIADDLHNFAKRFKRLPDFVLA